MELVVGASNDAVKSLVSKLGSLLAQEHALIGGVRDDIQYMNDELASMQAFLNRLKRADGGHDEQRQDWMKQVREVSYDIEDCVDNVSHRLGGEPRGSGYKVYLKKAWYVLTTLYARRCIATEIRDLKTRAQHISDRRTRYGVENLAICGKCGGQARSDARQAGADAPRDRPAPPPQLIGAKAPVGIDDAMMKELEPCFSNTKNNDTGAQENPGLSFVAIVGFGGLGKTTFAMELYRKFGDDFDCRASVLASQKFQLPTVLKSLVKQLHEQSGASKTQLDGIEGWRDDVLKEKLKSQLEDKRYLILIDDIWSVSAWENIRDSLPRNNKPNTIIVTTRFRSVSEACRRQDGHVHERKQLDEENSYKLFRQIIPSAPEIPPHGAKDVLKKCGGLPLAIILVAGLIASKINLDTYPEEDSELAEVGNSLSEDLGNNLTTEGVTHILKTCYDQLRADLKTCLLYMSMFPKGCCISRKCLIRRWIAEGFIQERKGHTVEEAAEHCFDELIRRNMVRAVNNSSNGKVKSCRIHDMVLEYIVNQSSDENFITVVGGHWQTPFPTYKVRRLSIQKSEPQEKEIVEKMKLSHVRSLTASEISFSALHPTLLKFKILHVLDLEGCKDLSSNHVKKICKMHQLKYLSLRHTDIKKIPKKIGRLENLKVLDLRDTEVDKLPASVDKLQKMMHLLAGNKSKRTALNLTEGITKMTALQTLCGVKICTGSALAALENLTNLKKFSIYKLEGFTDGDNLLLLSAIEHLSSCSLKLFAIHDDFTGFLDSSLNASQAPPEHLQSLGLSGMLSQLPNWIGSLDYLEKLTISLTSLTTDTLGVIAKLPKLFSLIFSLDSTMANVLKILHNNTNESGGKIFVLAGGFGNLKLLRFVTPVVPPLNFLERAMPGLEKLELRFRMVEGVYGLENLESLQQVHLTVSSQAPKDAKAKVSQIKQLASMIYQKVNCPTVVVDEYNESSD